MTKSQKTPVAELIEALSAAMQSQIKTEDVEKMMYSILEREKHVIAEAYEAAMTNITNGVSMDGYEYYDSTFDNTFEN